MSGKASFLVAALTLASVSSNAQHVCGNTILLRNLEQADPAAYASLRLAQDQATDKALATPVAYKTTAQSPVPTVFHIVVTNAQWITMGRDTGIIRRVRSQLAVLNEDFGGYNVDKSKVPSGFLPVFGTTGLQFGLAGMTNAQTIAPGIEVKILSSSANFTPNDGCADVKRSTNGLAGWDPDKYYNIWVCNIGAIGGGQVLGVTIPPSYLGVNLSGHVLTREDLGFTVQYNAFGRREFSSQYFISGSDRGRTATHETGHYFELRHTWGDDGGSCPGQAGGYDDGIADTPPEADATYCNKGASGTACPTYPYYDACSPSGNGVMFMNYMDYANDTALLMFTQQQVALMQSNFQQNGRSYGLTQNPGLLSTGQTLAKAPREIAAWPNPATAFTTISWQGYDAPRQLELTDALGQTVEIANLLSGNNSYQFDLTGLPRGLYTIRANFADGTIVRKIVLQ